MQQGGILIVDDNEINRVICSINLEEMRVPLHYAENGQQGLDLALKTIPDLILLDIMMPVMDGFELLRRLKREEALSGIPVLMLSAKSETDSVVKALELGANDYLKKPFEAEEMVARVKTLLRSRYLEKQIQEDLVTGAAMQRKFLTDSGTATHLLGEAGIQTEIYNKPYGSISGDFYYAYPLLQNGIGVFLGDSCGHGLPAALISMRIIGFLQQIVKENPGPADILSRLNNDLYGLLPAAQFVAGSCLAFSANSCTISSAAQPYPVLLTDKGLEEIHLDGLPLGMRPDNVYQESSIEMNHGDRLIIYTDGVIEATDWQEAYYGKKGLYGCLSTNSQTASLQGLKDVILEDLHHFCKNAPFDDDQTIILFERIRI
ncbi:MAG: fused response regulator/phosphatase [Desulfobulbaceae bacterium]|nr:MAG: fused response regulator/phosphatase [Desulfobulbaceae bacterium]